MPYAENDGGKTHLHQDATTAHRRHVCRVRSTPEGGGTCAAASATRVARAYAGAVVALRRLQIAESEQRSRRRERARFPFPFVTRRPACIICIREHVAPLDIFAVGGVTLALEVDVWCTQPSCLSASSARAAHRSARRTLALRRRTETTVRQRVDGAKAERVGSATHGLMVPIVTPWASLAGTYRAPTSGSATTSKPSGAISRGPSRNLREPY